MNCLFNQGSSLFGGDVLEMGQRQHSIFRVLTFELLGDVG
jgi:hypothetical protein